jgi:hypothetical protein
LTASSITCSGTTNHSLGLTGCPDRQVELRGAEQPMKDVFMGRRSITPAGHRRPTVW